jgi:membrane-bound metal-dependent hydrolase YbcI (DUF457 family)
MILDLIRDRMMKKKNWISNKFVFLAGVAGLLPDLDMPLFTIMESIGIQVQSGVGHRLFFHNIWIPLFFLAFFAIMYALKKVQFSRVFLVLAFGFTIHLMLDIIVVGSIVPLFPLNMTEVGLNLSSYVPINPLTLVISMDAVLLLLWLWHEQIQHKIKDYF